MTHERVGSELPPPAVHLANPRQLVNVELGIAPRGGPGWNAIESERELEQAQDHGEEGQHHGPRRGRGHPPPLLPRVRTVEQRPGTITLGGGSGGWMEW